MGIVMTAIHATLFKSNKTQAVRLPKPVASGAARIHQNVAISAIGNTRIITMALKDLPNLNETLPISKA